MNIAENATEQELRDARKTVQGWCSLREYTTEEIAALRNLRDDLTERIIAKQYEVQEECEESGEDALERLWPDRGMFVRVR